MLFRDEIWLKKKRKKYETDIKILELKLQKQAYKKSLRTGVFSKRVIIFCILLIYRGGTYYVQKESSRCRIWRYGKLACQ
jgi:hypothetical protein